MQSRIVGKKRPVKRQLSKELMYGNFKRSVTKKLVRSKDEQSLEQASIRKPRVRVEVTQQSKPVKKERIRQIIAPFIGLGLSKRKMEEEQKRSKHSALKQSRSRSMAERVKSQPSKMMNRIGIEGLSKEALEFSNGPTLQAIGRALSGSFAATAIKPPNKNRELLKQGIESAGPKFYQGELKERNISTVAVRSDSLHADFEDRDSINESDMPAMTITNRSDLEALNNMINFNEKNPDSNYSLTFDQVPHRRSREGQTLQLISPKIKCKRLSQKSDADQPEAAVSCERDREEGLRSIFSVKFVSNDKCEIFLPVDVDGIAVHDPSNPKSKKILTRQRTPFTKEKKPAVPEWQDAIPSFKQMVSKMEEDSRRIRLPPQTEAKLGSSNIDVGNSCYREPPKPFTQSHQAPSQDSRSHTPIKKDSCFDALEQGIFRPTHLLRRTDKDHDAKTLHLPERESIENSNNKEQIKEFFFQKPCTSLHLKSALKSESKRKFNLRSLYLEDHQQRPDLSQAKENHMHAAADRSDR